MTTRKKLHAARSVARDERASTDAVPADPTERPRWRRHTREMDIMLNGIDPDRFERLAR